MIQKAAALGLAAILMTSCTPMPKQAPTPPEAEAAPGDTAAVPAANAPEPPMAPTDVRQITCAALSSAQDDDKAYASTFLLGYRSALMRTHTIDIKRIEAVEEAALADCATKPQAKASQIFHAALLRIGPGGEPRAPRPHHPHRPAQGTAGAGTPEQPALEPASPLQTPPMQYAPAPGTTLPAPPAEPQQPESPAERPRQ